MIGKKLKQLRIEKGLLQKEFASKLNLTQQTISLYESNAREPDTETLDLIANYFNVSVDYLLGRTNIRNTAAEISNAVSDDPELSEFWNILKEREDLQLLFKQTKNMSPKDIKQIIRIIKALEDEEDKNCD